MLWKKESNDINALYIDLFQLSSHGRASVETQYLLNKMSKMRCQSDGSFYKNDITAVEQRKTGNRKFEKNQFFDAMEWYNKSLCFAKNGSKTLGLAYANRSNCFLKMKMFKKCLADIELAKENNYPANLMEKLNKRKTECLKLMKTEEDQGEIRKPQLDFEANEKFPCLTNVVDIQTDESGHHIVATADIEVGQTVILEQCYIGVTKYDHYKSCNVCLVENQNLIPCKKCTSALFCSDCNENDLHGIECDLNSGCPAGFKFMDVVRSISLAKNAFVNADELIVFVEDMLKSNAMELPSNLRDPRSKYRAFFKLCPDWQTYELYSQQAYLFYQSLLDQNDMTAFFHTKAHKRFLAHLVHHHISMILRGAYNKRTAPIGGVNITDTYINIIAKHLNHSCTPNVCHVFKDGLINCIVIRPISKNEELLFSHITFDIFGSEAQRRAILKSRYVDCKCERCKLESLSSNHRMQSDFNFQQIQKMFKIQTLCKGLYDRKQTDLMKEKCFCFLKKFGRMKWSIEMDRITEVLSFLLNEFIYYH